jgi:hypothetical protein
MICVCYGISQHLAHELRERRVESLGKLLRLALLRKRDRDPDRMGSFHPENCCTSNEHADQA